MIEVAKYEAGMSEALDKILSKGDARKAWVTYDDESSMHIIIADSAERAIEMHENLLRYIKIPPKKTVDSARIRKKP